MKDALGVQVGQTHGDVGCQFHPCAPAQVLVAVQQLLQVPAVDVLQGNMNHSHEHQAQNIRNLLSAGNYSNTRILLRQTKHSSSIFFNYTATLKNIFILILINVFIIIYIICPHSISLHRLLLLLSYCFYLFYYIFFFTHHSLK